MNHSRMNRMSRSSTVRSTYSCCLSTTLLLGRASRTRSVVRPARAARAAVTVSRDQAGRPGQADPAMPCSCTSSPSISYCSGTRRPIVALIGVHDQAVVTAAKLTRDDADQLRRAGDGRAVARTVRLAAAYTPTNMRPDRPADQVHGRRTDRVVDADAVEQARRRRPRGRRRRRRRRRTTARGRRPAPAVMPTRPASDPLPIIAGSGLPAVIQSATSAASAPKRPGDGRVQQHLADGAGLPEGAPGSSRR